MKRIALLAAALAMMVSLVAAPGIAWAGSKAYLSEACQGHPWLDRAEVLPTGGQLPWGYVDICWNGSEYFSIFIHLDASGRQSPMPAGFFANAWILRWKDGVPDGGSSCDGGDGNKHVVPGEIWCRTNTIGTNGASVATFRGDATVYRLNGSNWVAAATGRTRYITEG